MKTERLLLRRAKKEDADELFAIRQSEFVLQYNCMEKLDSAGMLAMVLNDRKNDYVWYMERLDDYRVIGAIYLHEDSVRYCTNTKELSYWMSKDDSGQGLMKEALDKICKYAHDEMKLSGITARCFEANLRSRRVLEKLGFVQEGILKNAVKGYQNIIYNDVLYYLDLKQGQNE